MTKNSKSISSNLVKFKARISIKAVEKVLCGKFVLVPYSDTSSNETWDSLKQKQKRKEK